MFVKHGDGKIVSVIDEEELSDEQKKASKDLSKQVVKQSDTTDTSERRSQGDN